MTDRVRMPLTEAARVLGTTTDALRQKIKRGRLLAVRDNTGRLMVEIDPDRPVTEQTSGRSDLTSAERPDGMSSHVKALEEHLNTLREQIERMRTDHATEVDRMRDDHAAQIARADAERDRLMADHAAAVTRLEEQLRVADTRTGEMLREIEALRVVLTDAMRPWWRRMLGR
jgi:hypothetical protein